MNEFSFNAEINDQVVVSFKNEQGSRVLRARGTVVEVVEWYSGAGMPQSNKDKILRLKPRDLLMIKMKVTWAPRKSHIGDFRYRVFNVNNGRLLTAWVQRQN